MQIGSVTPESDGFRSKRPSIAEGASSVPSSKWRHRLGWVQLGRNQRVAYGSGDRRDSVTALTSVTSQALLVDLEESCGTLTPSDKLLVTGRDRWGPAGSRSPASSTWHWNLVTPPRHD